jgi:hypothetical protein
MRSRPSGFELGFSSNAKSKMISSTPKGVGLDACEKGCEPVETETVVLGDESVSEPLSARWIVPPGAGGGCAAEVPLFARLLDPRVPIIVATAELATPACGGLTVTWRQMTQAHMDQRTATLATDQSGEKMDEK